ncbi:MAG: hypothetical protein NVS2B12_15820 [Ktedonobacteraceae bacterium]
MHIDTFYILCAAAVIIGLIWLFVHTFFSTSYRCSKCGYETNSEIAARVHETLENTHKMVS